MPPEDTKPGCGGVDCVPRPSTTTMEIKTVLTTVISGSRYLVHPQVLGTIQETINPDVIIPVTVLEPEQLYYHLEGTLRLFDFYDDVFTPEFGNILIEKPGGNSGVAVSSVGNGKSVMRLRNDSVAAAKRSVSDLPAGPYILHGPYVHQAWKIYNDTLDAFAFGVYPERVDEVDLFRVLQLPADSETNYTSIPVPSKLYSTVPPEQAPLKGYRFTIPDSMSLKGIPTTLSSSEWHDLHDNPAGSTAAFAKRLIDLGATIVGKTKSSQFGSGREWTDVPSPKNPREDGHQDPAGGATGAASSLAGYEWLRATTGIDLGSTFDSMGIFGTDLSELFHDAVAVVHKSLASPVISFPKTITYLTDFSSADEEKDDKYEQFLASVEAFLGVKSTRLSLTQTWASKPPAEAKGQGLQEYMRDAPFLSFCYEFYRQYDEFRKDYKTKFGKDPATEPTVKQRWDWGSNVTKSLYDEYQARLDVFRNWFDSNIMSTNHGGDAILVAAYPSHAPSYGVPKPSKINGVTPDLLASVLRAPQILAPFAQFEYQSKVSGRPEYHPVYGAVLGPEGSDTMLVKLVQAAFQQAQWRTRVDKGRYAFPPAQNARNVDDRPIKGPPGSLEAARQDIGLLIRRRQLNGESIPVFFTAYQIPNTNPPLIGVTASNKVLDIPYTLGQTSVDVAANDFDPNTDLNNTMYMIQCSPNEGILFDTLSSGSFFQEAVGLLQENGLAGMSNITLIASHEHQDHTGGLSAVDSVDKLRASQLVAQENNNAVEQAQVSVGEEQTLTCGNATINLFHTQGHTTAGVMACTGDYCLTGDECEDSVPFIVQAKTLDDQARGLAQSIQTMRQLNVTRAPQAHGNMQAVANGNLGLRVCESNLLYKQKMVDEFATLCPRGSDIPLNELAEQINRDEAEITEEYYGVHKGNCDSVRKARRETRA
ncbi:hypothetical protein MHUMG1_07512 [Metarhizium humberi]|uniref:Metallo-beta-lactamase domain-containing protein n=1 Tax=Metarhizium humberi TaxID=2596975 RepID=A0A9P8S5X1_9HYPO|nr:hypothetical protein MHUMG1_07512 [Metarhizium humberi]